MPAKSVVAFAGAARGVPAGRLPGEALVDVDSAAAGRAHRDVRYAAASPDDVADAVLAARPGKESGLAAAACQRVGPVVAEDELLGRDVVGVVPGGVR